MSKLIIVESPEKAKTIKKYLGTGYDIVASKGHIRDLPAAKLSVDVKKDFEPKYSIVKGKESLVKELKEAVKDSDKVFLATGYTDLRRGMEGLAAIIRFQFELDPYDKNTLFLFCGKRTVRIKGLLWEGDGFLLLYKRIENGSFKWPRSVEEVMEITPEQYHMLMQGMEIVAKHPIQEITNPAYAM